MSHWLLWSVLTVLAQAPAAQSEAKVHIYTVPASPKFGILPRNTSPSQFDNSKFKREYTPQAGPLPLVLPAPKGGEEIGFSIAVPAIVAKPKELVEIEPAPFVVPIGMTMNFAASDELVEKLSKVVDTGSHLVGDGEMQYLIKGDVPKNIFLLYLPKGADLKTLQGLYPEKQAFKFADDKAKQMLADTALPVGDVAAYLDLLHRGGAILAPGKDGLRVYFAVMPDGEVMRHVIQTRATSADSPPKEEKKPVPAPVAKTPLPQPETARPKAPEVAKPNTPADLRGARVALSQGRALLNAKQDEKAIKYLEKAVSLAPNSEFAAEARTLLQGLKK